MKTLYFAYASNMHPAQMIKRCPQSKKINNMRLDGWKFAISPKHTGANAIKTDNKEDHVWGVLYEISKTDEIWLDACEGIEQGEYQKTYITLSHDPKQKILIYSVPGCTGHTQPYKDYHLRIIDGLIHNNICERYTLNIKGIQNLGKNHPERCYVADADGT